MRFDGVHDISQYDYVWLATGGTLDLSLVPIFASLQSQHPIDGVRGLPVLQDDLSWAERASPLYIMGVFAQLQLGADALNLAGARSGSVLVARALIEDDDDDDDDKPDGGRRWCVCVCVCVCVSLFLWIHTRVYMSLTCRRT